MSADVDDFYKSFLILELSSMTFILQSAPASFVPVPLLEMELPARLPFNLLPTFSSSLFIAFDARSV